MIFCAWVFFLHAYHLHPCGSQEGVRSWDYSHEQLWATMCYDGIDYHDGNQTWVPWKSSQWVLLAISQWLLSLLYKALSANHLVGKRSDTANIQLHYIKGAKTIIEVLNWRKAFCLASNLFMSSGETALLKNQKEFTERLERWLTLCKHRELSSDPEHPHKNWATASVTPAFVWQTQTDESPELKDQPA